MTPQRNGNKWNVNELLSLQREYELLELSIQEIALKHERTVDAILYKLYNEDFIGDFHLARGYPEYAQQTQTDLLEPSINYCEFNGSDESTVLFDRVSKLETDVDDMKFLLHTLMTTKTHTSKRAPLRKYNVSGASF